MSGYTVFDGIVKHIFRTEPVLQLVRFSSSLFKIWCANRSFLLQSGFPGSDKEGEGLYRQPVFPLWPKGLRIFDSDGMIPMSTFFFSRRRFALTVLLAVAFTASAQGQDYRRLPLPQQPAPAGEFRPTVAEYSPRYGEEARNTAGSQQSVTKTTVVPADGSTKSDSSTEGSTPPSKEPNKFTESFRKASESTKAWFSNTGQSINKFFKENAAPRESEAAEMEQEFRQVRERKEQVTASQLFSQGIRAEQDGLFDEAERDYLRSLQMQQEMRNRQQAHAPGLGNLYHRLAVVCWRQEKMEAAEIYFKKALSTSPWNNVPLTTDYALFLEGNGKYRQSELMMRNALVQNPENPRVLRLLGRSLGYQGRHAEAMRHLTTAVGREAAAVELAAISRRQGDEALARLFDAKYRHETGDTPAREVARETTPQRPETVVPPNRNDATGNTRPTQANAVIEKKTIHADTPWQAAPNYPIPVPTSTGISNNASPSSSYHYAGDLDRSQYDYRAPAAMPTQNIAVNEAASQPINPWADDSSVIRPVAWPTENRQPTVPSYLTSPSIRTATTPWQPVETPTGFEPLPVAAPSAFPW